MHPLLRKRKSPTVVSGGSEAGLETMSTLSRKELAGRLTEIIRAEPCTLFAGAGTANRAGMPTWHAYLTFLADFADSYEPAVATIMRKRIKSNLLLDAAHYYKTCVEIPVGDKMAKLAEPFAAGKYTASRLDDLCSLPFAAMVTTNYDRSLHDAIVKWRSEAAQCVELQDPTLRAAAFWNHFYIARIHGRAELPETIVLEQDDYNRLYSDPDYQDFLHNLLVQKRCIFLGFSFLDPAIERVLDFIRDKGVYPQKHYALVPAGSQGLRERMASYNIEILEYDGGSNHETLWSSIADVASSLRADPREQIQDLPSVFDTARRLLAVCYVRAKIGKDVTALRNIVVQGIVLSELAKGLSSVSEVAKQLQNYLPLKETEALTIASSAIDEMVDRKMCMREEDAVVLVQDLKDQTLASPATELTKRVANRLIVREKLELKPEIMDALQKTIEEVIVLRGFDMGAEFSTAQFTSDVDPLPTIKKAIDRHLKGYWEDRKGKIADALLDLLRRPDPQEEAILADLGRISFGIEVVLQAGRSTMYALSLPEIIYLDSNVLMPAIVRGHPYRPSYLGAITKLQEAATREGASAAVVCADVFLDEIINHRKKAITLVEELGLENPETLKRRIQYFGADNVNVFVGAYSTWISDASGDRSFAKFLTNEAPYSNHKTLAEYLKNLGIRVVSIQPKTQVQVKAYQAALDRLDTGYETLEAGLEDWQKKPLVLKKHEAFQLAALEHSLSTGKRSIFVTANRTLRRAVAVSDFAGLEDSLMSHRNLIQLVDLLVGVPIDAGSLTRLLWTIRIADERAALKDYLITRALPHYSAALMLKMSDLLDGYVEKVLRDAELEDVDLLAVKSDERIKTSKFLDRVEDKFFDNMAEEVRKLNQHIKLMETK